MNCTHCQGVVYLDIGTHTWLHTGEQGHKPVLRMAHVPPPPTKPRDPDGGYSDFWRVKRYAFLRRYHWKRPRTIFGLP